MNKKRSGFIICSLLILVLCFTASCGLFRRDNSLEKVLESGQLVLGMDANFPPMGYTDENGDLVGFDVDMAEEVCKRLGVTLVKQPINWDEKEDDLNTGRIDCIWNGLSVNSERAESMNLSDSYMFNELVFIINDQSSIKSIRELKGCTIGVQTGSSAETALQKSDIFNENDVIGTEDNLMLLEKLESGEIDAAFLDSIFAYYSIVKYNKNFFILPGNLGDEELAIGFRKDDSALRNRVQEVINEMAADGTLKSISEKWFGGDVTIK